MTASLEGWPSLATTAIRARTQTPFKNSWQFWSRSLDWTMKDGHTVKIIPWQMHWDSIDVPVIRAITHKRLFEPPNCGLSPYNLLVSRVAVITSRFPEWRLPNRELPGRLQEYWCIFHWSLRVQPYNIYLIGTQAFHSGAWVFGPCIGVSLGFLLPVFPSLLFWIFTKLDRNIKLNSSHAVLRRGYYTECAVLFRVNCWRTR